MVASLHAGTRRSPGRLPQPGAPALLDPLGGGRGRPARARSDPRQRPAHGVSPGRKRAGSGCRRAGPGGKLPSAVPDEHRPPPTCVAALFSLAALSGALANLWVAAAGLFGAATAPPVGDVFLIVALLLVAAGLVTYPATPRRGTDLTRMVLDGVVLGGSVLLIASDTLFPQILNQSGPTIADRVAPLVIPVIDLILGHGRLAALHPRQSLGPSDSGDGRHGLRVVRSVRRDRRRRSERTARSPSEPGGSRLDRRLRPARGGGLVVGQAAAGGSRTLPRAVRSRRHHGDVRDAGRGRFPALVRGGRRQHHADVGRSADLGVGGGLGPPDLC